MALGLPEKLWREAQSGFPKRKAADKMVRLNVPLDPAKTGREASTLETGLRRMIIGQDEAIQQIVNIYQMHLTGMNAPGRPIGNFLFLGPTGSGKTRTSLGGAGGHTSPERGAGDGQAPLDSGAQGVG